MDKPDALGSALASLLEIHFTGDIGMASKADECQSRIALKGWQIVEEVSVASDLYVLLRRIREPTSGLTPLTAREYEAARLASSRASNKEIAHEMGVSASTVGVLLWRVRQKVGVADREALRRIFSARGR